MKIRMLKDHTFPDGEKMTADTVFTTNSDAERTDLIDKGLAVAVEEKPKAAAKTTRTVEAATPDPIHPVAGLDEIAEAVSAKIMKQLFADARANPGDRSKGLAISVGVDPKNERFINAQGKPNFCEYAKAVHALEMKSITDDQVRKLKAAAGSSTLTDADGNVLIPEEMSSVILTKAFTSGKVLSRVSRIPVNGQYFSVRYFNETSRVDGSRAGGVRAYWQQEAAQYTSSKPTYGKLRLELEKLTALWYSTDELLDDTMPGFANLVFDEFAKEITFKIEDAIINGTGVGMPLGIMNASCLVTTGGNSGGTARKNANEILYEDWTAMQRRLYTGPDSTVAILFNRDVIAQLLRWTVPGTTSAVFPPLSVMPVGGVQSPFGILGGQWADIEYAQTLGTAGDFMFFDGSQYVLPMKSAGTDFQTSIHFKFDTGEQAFRWTTRLNGAPWWNSAVTPKNGTVTLSPFVVLG